MTNKLQASCTASITASGISTIAWAENLSSIIGLIGTIISAIFGLLSLIILIYNKLHKIANEDKDQDGKPDGLKIEDLIEAIEEGKEGADPYIDQIKSAIDKYENLDETRKK